MTKRIDQSTRPWPGAAASHVLIGGSALPGAETGGATRPGVGRRTMEFMTPDERARLQARLDELKARRPELSQRIADARALGDLKENADYHAAREDQALDEAEIKSLEARLAGAKVLTEIPVAEGVVFLGATVKLREVESGDEELYRLVGEMTGDASLEYVEVTATSPMGESLMKARVGEVIRVDAPRRVMRFEVVAIL